MVDLFGRCITALAAISLIVTACTSGTQTQDPTKPGEVNELEKQVGFGLAWPRVLPADVDSKATVGYDRDRGTATLSYYALAGARDQGAPVIFITENDDPSGNVCPPCPGRDSTLVPPLQLATVDGLTLYSDEGRSSPDRVRLTYYFRQDDLRITVDFDWRKPGVPLVVDEKMRQDALSGIESMFPRD